MQRKLDSMFQKIWTRKIPFFIVFFFVVLATYAFLVIVDFVPESPEAEAEAATGADLLTAENEVSPEATDETSAAESMPEPAPVPLKIIFEDLDREVTVLNPESREIADLDAALLKGVVRHPDSADFTEPGNVFILGHSSYLPNVLNKNFQAFNGIQNLTWGDAIRVQSENMEYTYLVEDVYEAAASEVIVPHTPGKARLTLATCNSFGSKDDRFIVEARLLDQRPL